MKVTFEFDPDNYETDDKAKMELMLQADKMALAFEEIHNKVWRPYYKHGYDKEIEDLLELCPTIEDKDGNEVNVGSEIIEKLHDIYRGIIFDEYDLKLD